MIHCYKSWHQEARFWLIFQLFWCVKDKCFRWEEWLLVRLLIFMGSDASWSKLHFCSLLGKHLHLGCRHMITFNKLPIIFPITSKNLSKHDLVLKQLHINKVQCLSISIGLTLVLSGMVQDICCLKNHLSCCLAEIKVSYRSCLESELSSSATASFCVPLGPRLDSRWLHKQLILDLVRQYIGVGSPLSSVHLLQTSGAAHTWLGSPVCESCDGMPWKGGPLLPVPPAEITG